MGRKETTARCNQLGLTLHILAIPQIGIWICDDTFIFLTLLFFWWNTYFQHLETKNQTSHPDLCDLSGHYWPDLSVLTLWLTNWFTNQLLGSSTSYFLNIHSVSSYVVATKNTNQWTGIHAAPGSSFSSSQPALCSGPPGPFRWQRRLGPEPILSRPHLQCLCRCPGCSGRGMTDLWPSRRVSKK